MTGRVKSYCSVVVRFSSLLYSALRVSLDRGGTTLRMQCILDFHRSREHSLAVRRNTDLLPQRQIGRPLPLDTDIPDHRSLPLRQPSFTLDVPSGNMQNQNSEDYLCDIEESRRC